MLKNTVDIASKQNRILQEQKKTPVSNDLTFALKANYGESFILFKKFILFVTVINKGMYAQTDIILFMTYHLITEKENMQINRE